MIRQVEAIPVAVRPPTEARPPEDHLQEVSPLEDLPQGMTGTEEVTPQVSDARLTWILEEDHQWNEPDLVACLHVELCADKLIWS